MARTNKRSRIKGLPPKVYLRTRDAHTGSYPSHIRTDTDGLTGNSPIFWDDTNTMVFTTQSNNIYLGVNVEKSYLDKPVYSEIYGKDLSSSLGTDESDVSVTGSIRKGVSDVHVGFTPGDAYKPFNEHKHYDIKSNQYNNPFYVSGSFVEDVGEGFSQPLWSKTKIVIDLTPSVSNNSLDVTNYTSQSSNYPMGYWNNDTKLWEGIGTGKEASYYDSPTATSSSVYDFIENHCLGFAHTFNFDLATPGYIEYGAPITTFGFPQHIKYHATSSNLINMGGYINAPFLLEKVVVDVVCSQQFNNTYSDTSNYSNGILTFFLLNQTTKSKVDVTYKVYTIEGSEGVSVFDPEQYSKVSKNMRIKIPSSSLQHRSGEYITSNRELVTYSQVSSYQEYRDKNVVSKDYDVSTINGSTSLNWNLKRLVVSSSVRVADKSSYDGFLPIDFSLPRNTGPTYPKEKHSIRILPEKITSNRKNTQGPGPRDYLNSIRNSTPYETQLMYDTVTVSSRINPQQSNPYLLLPTDNLVIGVQIPTPFYNNVKGSTTQVWTQGQGTKITFSTSPSKITLYGSYIKEGKEYHDTATTPLTSDSIHEVIGEE